MRSRKFLANEPSYYVLSTHRECRTVVSYRAGLGDGTAAAICSDRACRCPPSDSDDRSKPSQRRMVSLLYRAIFSLVCHLSKRRRSPVRSFARASVSPDELVANISCSNFDLLYLAARLRARALSIFVSSRSRVRYGSSRKENTIDTFIQRREYGERIVRFWLSAHTHVQVSDILLMR